MGTFTGQLNSNEIMSALYNMIISQQTQANNLGGLEDGLLSMCRVDGSLYGDTKLYYDTDVLRSFPWTNDAETSNLLQTHRPCQPKCQKITLNVFRQIPLTVDYYLSKRAWGTEGAFQEFITVMLGWTRGTKRVYDYTLLHTFIGTNKTSVGKQTITITLPVDTDVEKQNKLQGQAIAKAMADLLVDLKKPSRDYTDNQNLKAIATSDLVAVWNSAALNQIEKYALPVIYHKDALIEKLGEKTLPKEYFGNVNTSGGTTTASNTTIRSLIEKDYNPDDTPMDDPDYDPKKHIFPGDLLPNSTPYNKNETYTQDDTILFKLIDKNSVPFMSAFEVGTSFFNPKALNENHYLTWGHNTLEHRKDLPFITVKGVQAEG